MEEYRIVKSELEASNYKFSESESNLACMTINHYPWDRNGYRPNAECQIIHCADGFKVRMKAYEKEIKATFTEMNDPVYKDSCLELFIAPYYNNPDYYFNFELNPLGTLLLGRGSKQRGRERIIMDEFRDYFHIKSNIEEENGIITGWSVEWVIPFKLLNEYQSEAAGLIGRQMKVNFYKCGDDALYPHHGCWNIIDWESPNFHVPQFFGNLILPMESSSMSE